jgi:hypothetical protein
MSWAKLQPDIRPTFARLGQRRHWPARLPCCCLFRCARRSGRRLERGPEKMGAGLPPPSRLRGSRGLNLRHQACAVGRNSIRGSRANVMIRHSIRVVVRISASLAARRDRRVAKPRSSRAQPRHDVAVHGAKLDWPGRTSPDTRPHARPIPADREPARRCRALTTW